MKNNIPNKKITIETTTRGFKITEGIKSKVENKVNPLSKLVRGNKTLKVTMKKEKNISTTSFLFYAGDQFIKVSATSNDLYDSIDKATKKLKNQLSKLSKSSEFAQSRYSLRYSPPECRLEALENAEDLEYDEDLAW